MKIEKIAEKKEQCFEPITIQITLESKEDVITFFAHSNICGYELAKGLEDRGCCLPQNHYDGFTKKLYSILDEEMRKLGYPSRC